MDITNIETIPGKTIIAHYGLVSGSTVRSKNAFSDIGASLKNIFGGELKSYTKLLDETRHEAVSRMTEQAKALGANAVVNVRFATSDVAAGAAEIYVYGTAVRVE
ncbi:YbjQ family protein [Candidatus Electronema sp. TJ]|uniref:YbjQ family protein n=1 Tax=Candidatus Electronema sp. TJ TaxID=3401573 RepID=UPI003AA9BF1A